MSVRRGFTMVELLTVVAIIGVMAGILVAVINVQAQRDRAADSIRISNLEQIVEAVEGYYAIEGDYPIKKDDTLLTGTYMTSWPDGSPAGAVYQYSSDTGHPEFGVLVISSRSGITYKYNSLWGEIRECSNAEAADSDNLLDESICN